MKSSNTRPVQPVAVREVGEGNPATRARSGEAGARVLAVAVEGRLPGAMEQAPALRAIVVGDGDFVVNGKGEEARRQTEDNINFALNAIDWLSDDTGLIALRTKDVAYRPLELLNDSTRNLLKYLNFFLPILLVGGYGLLRNNRRRSLRMRRMNQNFREGQQ